MITRHDRAGFIGKYDDVVKAVHAFGMTIQKSSLPGKLLIVGPIIIAFQHRDIFSPTGRQRVRKVGIHADVLRAAQHADAVGKFSGIFGQDVAGAVGGSIIANHRLIRKIRFLRQHAVQRLPDEPGVVVGDHQHADFRLGIHHI